MSTTPFSATHATFSAQPQPLPQPQPSPASASASAPLPSASPLLLNDPSRMVGQPLQALPGSFAHHHLSTGPLRPAQPHHGHLPTPPARTTTLGGIPVISSGSGTRTPSGFLPQRSNSSTSSGGSASAKGNYYRQQSRQASANTVLARQQQQQHAALAQQQAIAAQRAQASQAQVANGKGKAREMVDLTTGSDGEQEVHTISSGSDTDVIVDDRPICIGQITSLALILYAVADIVPPMITHDANGVELPPHMIQPAPLPPTGLPPLPVHLYHGDRSGANETIKIINPRKRESFGVMEQKVANVLGPLLGDGFSGVGVQAKTNGRVWCEASVVRRGERNPMMLPLLLLLFTKPSDVQIVSTTLDHATIYLEHPASYNPMLHCGCRYSNPHNPAPGVSGRQGIEAERRRQQMMSGMFGSGAYGRQQQLKPVEVQRQQVDQVFSNLKSGLDLEEHTPPAMVTTKLYPHQKQAVSFLLDRERLQVVPDKDSKGEEPAMVSLWQRQSDPYGKVKGWRSLVTNLEITGDRPPPQARGSILADDMGLGKTIVVISLVCTTLDEAREWAKTPPEKDQVDERFDDANLNGTKSGFNLAEFGSNIPGLAPRQLAEDEAGASSSSGRKRLSKKDLAKAEKEKRQAKAVHARFTKLVTKSRATLIVCPLSTVQNWESQFEEHTGFPKLESQAKAKGRSYVVPRRALAKISNAIKDESESDATDSDTSDFGVSSSLDEFAKGDCPVSVYVYHGNARCQDPIKLADHDVVITTFSTVGTEYSKQGRVEREREEEDEVKIVGMNPDGTFVEECVKPKEDKKPSARKRKVKADGDGLSPLQQIQWFRVVLDEAHIIKEHTTIQARAACDLATHRRVALSGTPLQNSLNDLFSLISFLRLEPFTDRAVWTQHIGALAKSGDPLGVSRLQLIMRHLCLRRTKQSVDKDGKPILSLPSNNQNVVPLAFDPAEHAFYNSHHLRYKHDFRKLEETDSVMKNYCSILQELLRLRQICVHMALVKDSEDGEGGDVTKTIEDHGISKPRAIQLLALMRDAGGGQCAECGYEMLPAGTGDKTEAADEVEEKKPVRKARKVAALKSATASANNSDAEADGVASVVPPGEIVSVVTKCQHLFCQLCFRHKVCPEWPNEVKPEDRSLCPVCRAELITALDAVSIGAKELEKGLDEVDHLHRDTKGAKAGKGTRLFEHSTKTKALLRDVFPFSQANPASANYFPSMVLDGNANGDGAPRTIGFQPVVGEVVKSVVFSQWTKLLDRLGDALDESGIRYGRLDGGMNRDQRTKAMDRFKADPACEILLVSLRAGGVGLNLTVARRVYLMEPFWNPAVENQAIDRIHRLGQTRDVQTVRFVIEKSIEENMLKIQKRKMDLAK